MLAGKTPEQIAKWFSLKPDTPTFVDYVSLLESLNSPEANDRKKKFHDDYVSLCRARKDAGPLCTHKNVAASWDHWLLASSLYDFNLDDDDLKHMERRYTVLRLIQGEKPWPTGQWFRFAQTRWEASRWHMVPAFPSAMLALAGYKLATSWRYMGDLSDHDKARLFEIQLAAETRPSNGLVGALSPDERWELSTLLDCCAIGGEPPILDID